MNYVRGLTEVLINDATVQSLCGNRVRFLRMPKQKDGLPGKALMSIVFNEGSGTSEKFVNGQLNKTFDLLIDISCNPDDTYKALELRDYIIRLLDGSTMLQTTQLWWKGSISFQQSLGVDYDHTTDMSVIGIIFQMTGDGTCTYTYC